MDQSMLSDAKPRATAASMGPPDQTRAEDIVVRRPTKSDIPGLAAHFSEMQILY
jgi:hypothetical protein